MNSIDLMVKEHTYIKRMLSVVRKLCIALVNGNEVDQVVFKKAIDFIRNYADKHHHGKEEDILFEQMKNDAGTQPGAAALLGMYTEHNMGRAFIGNLEMALNKYSQGDKDSKVDIIANAIAYTDLLHRHIDTEDGALYKFAAAKLSDHSKEEVERRCNELEKDANEKHVQEKYLAILEELESIV